MLKKGELVKLIEDTLFYKKGSIAVIICEYDSQNRDSDKIEIRWEGEEYQNNDVDVMPKNLFKSVVNK